MALGIQDLMAAAQRAGVDPGQVAQVVGGGGEGPPKYDGSQRNRYIEGETSGMTVNGEYPGMSPPGQANMGAYLNAQKPMGGGGDLGSQLLGLVGKVASSPGGAQLMQQAIGALMGGGGSPGQDPRAQIATAQAGSPRMEQVPGGGVPENAGQIGVGPGPATDMDLMNTSRANQAIRGNLPIQYQGPDYTGFSHEVEPMPDPRQTPAPAQYSNDPREDQAIDYGRPTTYRGQQLQDRNEAESTRGMTTEQELEQARQGMGATKSGDPSADGNFPTPQAIKALEAGEISPKDFDAEWGKGAAAEIMGQSGNDGAADDGDHEYR